MLSKNVAFTEAMQTLRKNNSYPRGLFLWGLISGLSILKRSPIIILPLGDWLVSLDIKPCSVSQCWPLLTGRHLVAVVLAGESRGEKFMFKAHISSIRTVLATLNTSQLAEHQGDKDFYQWIQALSAGKTEIFIFSLLLSTVVKTCHLVSGKMSTQCCLTVDSKEGIGESKEILSLGMPFNSPWKTIRTY